MPHVSVRPLLEEDLEFVDQLQRICYDPSFVEDIETFRAKLQRFPQGCFIATVNHKPVGYMFMLPVLESQIPPPWNVVDIPIPDEPDCLHIHDVSVHPDARNYGIGRLFAAKAHAVAEAYRFVVMSLVAVQGTSPFWSKQGFTTEVVNDHMNDYGDDAKLLTRQVGSHAIAA